MGAFYANCAPHVLHETVEEVSAIERTWSCFGVVLYTEDRAALQPETSHTAIVQVQVGDLHTGVLLGIGLTHHETVVL